MDCMLWAMSFGGGTEACNDERQVVSLEDIQRLRFQASIFRPFSRPALTNARKGMPTG